VQKNTKVERFIENLHYLEVVRPWRVKGTSNLEQMKIKETSIMGLQEYVINFITVRRDSSPLKGCGFPCVPKLWECRGSS